jgi:hypothetical protein
MAAARSMFFDAERDHRCRAALERDLALTVQDPARRARHLRCAALHDACVRRADAYLIVGGSGVGDPG